MILGKYSTQTLQNELDRRQRSTLSKKEIKALVREANRLQGGLTALISAARQVVKADDAFNRMKDKA